jgi:putative endonuclease
MARKPALYILANRKNGTLYIGVTSDLIKRVWQHKMDFMEGFTKKYQVHLLVYFEFHETMRAAILREKQLKGWKRNWKLKIIERDNPNWRDLHDEIVN